MPDANRGPFRWWPDGAPTRRRRRTQPWAGALEADSWLGTPAECHPGPDSPVRSPARGAPGSALAEAPGCRAPNTRAAQLRASLLDGVPEPAPLPVPRTATLPPGRAPRSVRGACLVHDPADAAPTGCPAWSARSPPDGCGGG